jgi:hypothetical protein
MATTDRDQAKAAAPARSGRAKGRAGGRAAPRLKTFAEAMHARPSIVTGAPVGSRWPSDATRGPRSFRLNGATLLRLQAAVAGIDARTYETELRGRAPVTLDDFVNEALEAALTFYEDELNGGEEFSREDVRLTTGPVPGRPRRSSAESVQST